MPISPKPAAPSERVADGVGQRVAVGMARRAAVEGHLDPAQHQFAAGSEAMQIVADAGAAHRAPAAWARSWLR